MSRISWIEAESWIALLHVSFVKIFSSSSGWIQLWNRFFAKTQKNRNRAEFRQETLCYLEKLRRIKTAGNIVTWIQAEFSCYFCSFVFSRDFYFEVEFSMNQLIWAEWLIWPRNNFVTVFRCGYFSDQAEFSLNSAWIQLNICLLNFRELAEMMLNSAWIHLKNSSCLFFCVFARLFLWLEFSSKRSGNAVLEQKCWIGAEINLLRISAYCGYLVSFTLKSWIEAESWILLPSMFL